MILIIGAGAVGTTLAGYLAAAGQPVRLLVRNGEGYAGLSTMIVENGAGEAMLISPAPPVTTTLDLSDVTYVLICVKHSALDQVLAQFPVTLPGGVTLVSTLNGVSALPRMRERYPADRLANMTIMFTAHLLAPLRARLLSHPKVIIDSRDETLHGLFSGSAMRVEITQGPASAWGKLLLNLANAICAATHSSVKDLLSQPDLRCIYVAAIDEAVSLLDRANIDYTFPMPLPYPAYRLLLRHGGRLPWFLAKRSNGLADDSYPSMVADVAAGRVTEIDEINGELEALGRARNLPTPINDVLVSVVRSFAGQMPPRYLSPGELRTRLGL